MTSDDFDKFLGQTDPKFEDNVDKHIFNTGNPHFTKQFMEYEDKRNIDLKLLEMGYKFHQIIKMDPDHIKTKGKYLTLVITAIRFSMIGLIFVMVAQNYGDIIYVINCIKSISGFLQGLAKVIPLFVYPEYIIHIRLAVIKYFWKTSSKGEESENYGFWYKIMLSYQYSIYIMYSLMILQTIVNKTLMFPVYIPNTPFAFYILLLLQYIQFTTDMVLVIGVDLIFLSSCVIIWRQSKLLVNEFSAIDGESCCKKTMKQFSRCVRHHNIMLEYVNCVIESFKIPLLFQYMISVLGLCIDLYIISENPPMVELVASITYVIMLSCQLGLYCFIADKTSEMVEMVSIFINNTNWYNNPTYLNKMLVIVLCRSQRDVRFTAGGMTKIDKEAFTDIFKTALSFFTLVRQMKDK